MNRKCQATFVTIDATSPCLGEVQLSNVSVESSLPQKKFHLSAKSFRLNTFVTKGSLRCQPRSA